MLAKFFKDLWQNFKTDKLASVIGFAAALGAGYVTFATDWVQSNLGSKWYGMVVMALLGLLGAWVNRFKAPPAPGP